MARSDATRNTSPISIYLEEGGRRTFAVAVDWPGWARSGRTGEAAVEALADYAERYDVVVRAAGMNPLPGDLTYAVVARVPGNATTDFGAPGVVADLDHRPLPMDEAERQARLVEAAWARLDEIAATAPAELRKGPRGGGRDRDAIIEHVLSTEQAYRRKAGVDLPVVGDPADRAQVEAVRRRFLEMLREAESGPAASSGRTGGRAGGRSGSAWPPRYAARRFAWHALDHAWEIEDRSAPA